MNFRLQLTVILLSVVPLVALGEDRVWTGATDGNFLTAGNWDSGVPSLDDDLAVIDGGMNLPVTIPESAEMITIGGFQLGTSGETGGHVVQNGGTLMVSPFSVEGIETAYEFKSHIGDQGTLDSSWIMNNDAVMLFDAPFETEGFGFDTDGENSFDLEVGARTGESVGRLEMHDNSVLRISDDLKIGAEDNGNGLVIMDGNAVATIGSGISVGEGDTGVGAIQVSGNALLVTGNSAGPGESITGRTNEGYLTLTQGTVSLSDSAKVYARTLQHRSGEANVTLEGSSELHVFEVFEHAAPDLGNATVIGDVNGPQRTNHIGGQSGGVFNLSIKDDGVMSVDSELEGSPWTGLAVSGGSNRGGNADGGITVIEVSDRGSFTVQQDLHLTIGNGEAAESTLKVVGPDANVAVNGNLYMALDPDGVENLGAATLHSVITGNSHSTIAVGGEAAIANGQLSIELDGYSPRGGEVYTLVSAMNIEGDAFFETDFSMAELAEGLGWDLAIGDTSIVLSITGMLEGLLGDFDSMNGLDLGDINELVLQIGSGGGDMSFDLNGDEMVNDADINAWLTLKSEDAGQTFAPGDADLDGTVAFPDFLAMSGSFGQGGTNWSQGNFDGVNGTEFPDFLILSSNFGAGAGAEAAAHSQSVPEPSTGFFYGLVFLLSLYGQCRRSR